MNAPFDLFLRNAALFARNATPKEGGGGWKDVATTIMNIAAANLESTAASDDEWHSFVVLLGEMADRELASQRV